MKILLTGGAGYVGSACLRWLLARGHTAVAYDNLSLGHREAVPAECLVVGDIHDRALLAATLREREIEAVMHFAAATSVEESVSNPAFHYRNNVAGTLSVLEAMRDAGVRRMLFSSTCATYGLNPKVPMTEDSAQDPCSPYGRTKLAVEWLIRDFAHAHGLGFTLLRYFNAAGASEDGTHGEDHRPETHLIPIVLQYALGRRKELVVYGEDYPTPDGTCIRDYVHVDDLAQAHLLAIEATTPATAEVFNIGTGRGHSVLEVLRACEEVVGRPIPFRRAARRPGDAPALYADPAKLVGRLGWKPRHPGIRSIVETAWRWHRSRPEGYSAS